MDIDQVQGVNIRRIIFVLIWLSSLLVCILILVLMGITIFSYRQFESGLSFLFQLSSYFLPIVYLITGSFIATRQLTNIIGWLLILFGAALVVELVIEWVYFNFRPLEPTPIDLTMVWYSSIYWLIQVLSILHILLLFPTGKFHKPGWRWLSFATIGWAVFLVILHTISQPLTSTSMGNLPNPLGVIPYRTILQITREIWIPGLVLLLVLCLIGLFLRYRLAMTLIRLQMRWLLYSCSLFIGCLVVVGIFGFYEPDTNIGYTVMIATNISVALIPVSIAAAIMRFHLWDIDVLIRRTLVYSILSTILALVYFGGVTLLQGLFSKFTGEQSSAAIVLSTLSIAALFNPLHKRIRSFVDRRFYRSRYDSEKTLTSFSVHLRAEVNLDDLSTHITSVVEETFQPAHVSLYLLGFSSAATAGYSYKRSMKS